MEQFFISTTQKFKPHSLLTHSLSLDTLKTNNLLKCYRVYSINSVMKVSQIYEDLLNSYQRAACRIQQLKRTKTTTMMTTYLILWITSTNLLNTKIRLSSSRE